MANTAFTNYTVRGKASQIDKLHEIMNEAASHEATEKQATGFFWLKHLVEMIGTDPSSVECAGEWHGLERKDRRTLVFQTETHWRRCEDLEKVMRKRFPEISIHFFSSTPDEGFYEKDSDTVYKYDYAVDIEEDEMHYCTEREAVKIISEFLGVHFRSAEETFEAADEYNNENDDQITIRAVETVTSTTE